MLRQSFRIDRGGRYDLGQHTGRIQKVKLVAITVNSKAIRYTELNHREQESPTHFYVEVGRSLSPLDGGMVMVNKEEGVIETFISCDHFHESVVVTLDLGVERES